MNTQSLLNLRVEEACRWLALDQLSAATVARQRLAEDRDPDALHDLRVGLRRLRSVLRAYRPHLEDSVGRKLRRRLKRLAAATGAARDSEVHIEWLQERRRKLNPRHRSGLDWLVGWLETRKQSAYAEVRGKVVKRFDALARAFDRHLRRYTARLYDGDERPDSLRQVMAQLMDTHADELAAGLASVQSVADEERAHEARIAAKRLRYLAEPLRGEIEGADRVVAKVKALQDLLGSLHDASVFAGEFRHALEIAAAERARDLHDLALLPPAEGDETRRRLQRDPRPGLLALARLVRDHRDELFARLSRDWLDGAAMPFVQSCHALARSLERAGTETPPAPQRLSLVDEPPTTSRARAG